MSEVSGSGFFCFSRSLTLARWVSAFSFPQFTLEFSSPLIKRSQGLDPVQAHRFLTRIGGQLL